MPQWLELGSPVPVGVAAAALIAVLVWVLIRVPLRPAVKPWRAVVRQVVGVLSSILLSILVLALGLNATQGWYPTWASLAGAGEVVDVSTSGRVEAESTTTAPWATGQPSALQEDPRQNPAFGSQDWSDPDRSRYLTVTIPGQQGQAGHQALVWLPASYLSHPERFYPVVLAFAGVPGSISTYQEGDMAIGQRIEDLVGEQKMREAIVVVPDVFPGNLDTECVDASDGSVRTESWVTSSIVPWITANLRAVADRQGWATLGLSAGGWCSTMLTMRHPELFGHSVSMAGYFRPFFVGEAYRPEDDAEYDLARIAEQDAPDVRLWAWTAMDDEMPYTELRRFEPHVKAPTSLTTTLLESGGHAPSVWASGLPVGLSWLGESSQFSWVAA
ncbi:Alpha/Beta hydrolase fold [Propionibacterium ruminifibrarum]|uniref:Alpha/Beta hydrolase fold n=1 Tax=Propionibacterium ruminifibrarum TaxID=1962131 RepID=A0A375I1R6_9ACTN|nr:alpha/beta hydrolase-fold protein [Propionibacterium ruminifibrarum]SPF67333.1 Alpha/Beta hydrolase fold [Propionibacterium ruminifibrarum]